MSQWSPGSPVCTVLVDIRAGLRVPGWEPGGYTGWVIPGYYQPTDRAEEQTHTSEAGPEGPSRAWSGWVWGWDDPFAYWSWVRPPLPLPTPSGPGRSLQALPGRGLGSSAETARFDLIFHKVS